MLHEEYNAMSQLHRIVTPERFDAVLFDLDGVLTDTAKMHAACWKKMFDVFLRNRAAQTGGSWQPFDIDTDYKRYVDGKLRYEGVRSFLRSRGIPLPYGNPSDPAHRETICGLGNRKNELIQEVLAIGSAIQVMLMPISAVLEPVPRVRSSQEQTDGFSTDALHCWEERLDLKLRLLIIHGNRGVLVCC
jgi:beta-phosphoglucomutase-like phosphatase (HAD superfamily)